MLKSLGEDEAMIEIGIVGGTGYTGVELLRLLAQHPEANVRLITSRTEAGVRVGEMFPSLRGLGALERPRLQRSGRQRPQNLPRGLFRDAARRCHGAGAGAGRRRREDHRPGSGFPPEGSRAFRALVQDAARLSGPAGRIGVRIAGNASRGDLPRRASSATPAAIRPRSSSVFCRWSKPASSIQRT